MEGMFSRGIGTGMGAGPAARQPESDRAGGAAAP